LAELNQWLSLKEFNASEKVAAVTAIYNKLHIKENAFKAMQTYADTSFNALQLIDLPVERKQYLKEFADGLLSREN
jgi:geranylgeranyl diphosphate synthase type II